MLDANLFNSVFVFPILNLLMLFYKGFLFLKIPGAFGFAIIGLTVFVRVVLHPFFKQQLETSKKMQDIKPHMDRLNERHKKEPKRLQEEQLKLYQQFGINPASGCLFMIIQIPIFIALYNTLSLFLMNGGANKVIGKINAVLYSPMLRVQSIDSWFFGINLAVSPDKGGHPVYLIVPIVTGLLQYFQVQTSMPMTQSSNPTSEVKKELKDGKTSEVLLKKGEEKKTDSGDFQKAMNTQMKFIFPIMIGWFAYTLPIGLSVYWNIFSLFSIIQYKRTGTKS